MNKAWVLFFSIIIISYKPVMGSDIYPKKSFRQMKTEDIMMQPSLETCGPAAIATLINLSTMSRNSVTISDILQHLGKTSDFNLLDLKMVLLKDGIKAQGYHVSKEQLIAYLDNGGAPFIFHHEKPI